MFAKYFSLESASTQFAESYLLFKCLVLQCCIVSVHKDRKSLFVGLYNHKECIMSIHAHMHEIRYR